jgi:glycine/D-amino acid oxidase-like deaminating enzyme
MPPMTEVVVIGGGIIGCSAAAELAARGARVTIVEATGIGAGASGRNLGAIQHPFEPVLAALHHDSLDRYRALAAEHDGFALPTEPAGLLLLHPDPATARRQATRLAELVPELMPTFLDADGVVEVEPSLARGPGGVLLATGYPVPPASATDAFARLAVRRGATIRVGITASLEIDGGRVTGVRSAEGEHIAAHAVLVAAGPSSGSITDPSGAWAPIVRTWGVTVQLELGGAAPRHIVEEDAVDGVNRPAAATARAARAAGEGDRETPSLFSIASAGDISTLGSTFLPDEPDSGRIAPLLVRRGSAFLPAIASARVVARRVCARPQSVDGLPFIGAVAGIDGLFVCAGHGPWGISTGPGSAALVASVIAGAAVPSPELQASRPIGARP